MVEIEVNAGEKWILAVANTKLPKYTDVNVLGLGYHILNFQFGKRTCDAQLFGQ